jgi:hypothetical protein
MWGGDYRAALASSGIGAGTSYQRQAAMAGTGSAKILGCLSSMVSFVSSYQPLAKSTSIEVSMVTFTCGGGYTETPYCGSVSGSGHACWNPYSRTMNRLIHVDVAALMVRLHWSLLIWTVESWKLPCPVWRKKNHFCAFVSFNKWFSRDDFILLDTHDVYKENKVPVLVQSLKLSGEFFFYYFYNDHFYY